MENCFQEKLKVKNFMRLSHLHRRRAVFTLLYIYFLISGTNLTWPESGSALDEVFELYNSMERTQSYLMMLATFLFWIGLILDFSSSYATTKTQLLFSGSRIVNFFGSLTVFASVIVVGLPDYLEASNLGKNDLY